MDHRALPVISSTVTSTSFSFSFELRLGSDRGTKINLPLVTNSCLIIPYDPFKVYIPKDQLSFSPHKEKRAEDHHPLLIFQSVNAMSARRFLNEHPLDARRGRCTSPTGVACVLLTRRWTGSGHSFFPCPIRGLFSLPPSPAPLGAASIRDVTRGGVIADVCAVSCVRVRACRPTRGSSVLTVSLDFDSSSSPSSRGIRVPLTL